MTEETDAITFCTRNDQILNESCKMVCAHFEQLEPDMSSRDDSLWVSIDNFAEYLVDIDAGFGAPYSGEANFKVDGQIAVVITIFENKLSLTDLFPKLKNSAARDISRTAVYSKHVVNLVYHCWEILLGTSHALDANQLVSFHDLLSNHEGLQCEHVGKIQNPQNCESCSARYVTFPNMDLKICNWHYFRLYYVDTHGTQSIVTTKIILVKLLRQLIYQRYNGNKDGITAQGSNFPYIIANLGI